MCGVSHIYIGYTGMRSDQSSEAILVWRRNTLEIDVTGSRIVKATRPKIISFSKLAALVGLQVQLAGPSS